MKILTIEEGFPPELMSSHFALEFAQELTKRGHQLSVVTLFPRKHLLEHSVDIPRHKFYYWDLQYSNVRVLRVFPQFESESQVGRAIEYVVSPIAFFLGGLIASKKDIVHVGTPPLFAALTACVLAKLWNVPIVLKIWDIHPDALEKIGVIKNRFALRFLKVIERFVYCHADRITVMSKSYKEYLLKEGVQEGKIAIVHNWTYFGNGKPLSFNHGFRNSLDVEGKFLITYAGSLSWINDPETIIHSANLLKGQKDIVFLFCCDGIRKRSAIQMVKAMGITNVLFISSQPVEKYLALLSESDVCVVSLRQDFDSPALPARIPEILASSRPLIANVPVGSDTYQLINEAKCGTWVSSGDSKSFANAVLTLSRDRELAKQMGQNGRDYAEKHFSTTSCMDLYDMILRLAKQGRNQN